MTQSALRAGKHVAASGTGTTRGAEVCRGSAASDAGDDASASAHAYITKTLRHATWSIACVSLQLLSRADHAPLQRAHAPARH